jgi:hypothetical protein
MLSLSLSQIIHPDTAGWYLKARLLPSRPALPPSSPHHNFQDLQRFGLLDLHLIQSLPHPKYSH